MLCRNQTKINGEKINGLLFYVEQLRKKIVCFCSGGKKLNVEGYIVEEILIVAKTFKTMSIYKFVSG